MATLTLIAPVALGVVLAGANVAGSESRVLVLVSVTAVAGVVLSGGLRAFWLPLRKVERKFPDLASVVADVDALTPILASLSVSGSEALLLVAPDDCDDSATIVHESGVLTIRVSNRDSLSILKEIARSRRLLVVDHPLDEDGFFDVQLGRNPSEAAGHLLYLLERGYRRTKSLDRLRFSVAGEAFVRSAAPIFQSLADKGMARQVSIDVK